MRVSNQKWVAFFSWMAGLAAVLVALIIPLGYFSMAFSTLSSATRTTAVIKSDMVEQVISGLPDLWKFQTLRLEEALAMHSHDAVAEQVAIIDTENNIVVQQGQPPLWPVVARSVPLFEAGTPIGRLKVTRSLRRLLAETSAVGLVALLLGIFIFLVLRTLPLRLLNRTLDALRREKERLQVTLHSIADAVITTNLHEWVDYMNPVAEQLTGWREEEARGKPLATVFCLVNEPLEQAVESPMKRVLAEKCIVPGTEHAVLRRRDDHMLAIDYRAAPIILPGSRIAGGVLVFHDATAERERSQQLSWQADHDGLTGLYNHRVFYILLADEIARARRFGRSFSLLMIDIDHFKHVNDTYGHRAGDAILKDLSELLLEQARAIDRVCRYGGEEIVVILPEVEGEAALHITERLRMAVAQKVFDIGGGVNVTITVSIGLATYPQQAATSEDLVKASDAALYAAKRAGRNRVLRYEPGMEASTA